jgi:hypothetical protein
MKGVLLCFLLLAATLPVSASENLRVFITDSKSWEVGGGFGGGDDAVVGSVKGGARPQTAEIMKTFGKRCPEATVTIKREKADYIIVLDHEGGKNLLRRDNKVAVFNSDGDMIYSGSTRMLGNAVKNACRAVRADAASHPDVQ